VFTHGRFSEVAIVNKEGKRASKNLPSKKRGRPVLLGEKVDSYVKQYLKML